MTRETNIDANRLALERTHMAAERTYFSVLRTGLAIAGAGTVIVGIVGGHRSSLGLGGRLHFRRDRDRQYRLETL